MRYTILVHVAKTPDDKGNYVDNPGFVTIHVTARSAAEATKKATRRILPQCNPNERLSVIR